MQAYLGTLVTYYVEDVSGVADEGEAPHLWSSMQAALSQLSAGMRRVLEVRCRTGRWADVRPQWLALQRVRRWAAPAHLDWLGLLSHVRS